VKPQNRLRGICVESSKVALLGAYVHVLALNPPTVYQKAASVSPGIAMFASATAYALRFIVPLALLYILGRRGPRSLTLFVLLICLIGPLRASGVHTPPLKEPAVSNWISLGAYGHGIQRVLAVPRSLRRYPRINLQMKIRSPVPTFQEIAAPEDNPLPTVGLTVFVNDRIVKRFPAGMYRVWGPWQSIPLDPGLVYSREYTTVRVVVNKGSPESHRPIEVGLGKGNFGLSAVDGLKQHGTLLVALDVPGQDESAGSVFWLGRSLSKEELAVVAQRLQSPVFTVNWRTYLASRSDELVKWIELPESLQGVDGAVLKIAMTGAGKYEPAARHTYSLNVLVDGQLVKQYDDGVPSGERIQAIAVPLSLLVNKRMVSVKLEVGGKPDHECPSPTQGTLDYDRPPKHRPAPDPGPRRGEFITKRDRPISQPL